MASVTYILNLSDLKKLCKYSKLLCKLTYCWYHSKLVLTRGKGGEFSM